MIANGSSASRAARTRHTPHHPEAPAAKCSSQTPKAPITPRSLTPAPPRGTHNMGPTPGIQNSAAEKSAAGARGFQSIFDEYICAWGYLHAGHQADPPSSDRSVPSWLSHQPELHCILLLWLLFLLLLLLLLLLLQIIPNRQPRHLRLTRGSLKYMSRRSSMVNHRFLNPSVC